MEISQKGLDLIKEFEGLYLKSYKCQAGVWTIGYGTIAYPYGDKVLKGDICTRSQAEHFLLFEVNNKCYALNNLIGSIGLELNQNEYNAIASFIFNLGEGLLQVDRSFGLALRSHDKNRIADTILMYCKYAGPFGIRLTSKGLLRRRTKERALFLTPV
jgi:lysozyme